MLFRFHLLRACVALCGCCLAGVSVMARADTPRYRAVELYTLQFPPSTTAGQGRAFAPDAAVAGQVVGSAGASTGTVHALIWGDPAGAPVDLHPTDLAGFTRSDAYGTDGHRQVGSGGTSPMGIGNHALLWNGTADSAVDLHPAALGFTTSIAVGIAGNQEVGNASNTTTVHAILWTGTAASAVDLDPFQLGPVLSSSALNTDGTHQVGFATFAGANSNTHAILWAGTAASAVDLNPTRLAGLTHSEANGVWGNQQVGYGVFPDDDHAILWNGTADSAIDLNPTRLPGFTGSVAVGTNGRQQVGYGGGPLTQALLWNGTPDSAVDLHALLPSEFLESEAFTIDAAGDVFGTAEANGIFTAVEWVPVPEPAAIAAIGFAAVLFRRRRCSRN